MTDAPLPQNESKPATCKLAGWSLGLGIAGVVIICAGILFAIPAVILGHMAGSRIKKSGGMLKGRSMAAAGTFLGYFILLAWVFFIFNAFIQKHELKQFNYHKDHEWQNVEAGTVLNIPAGRVTPNGRFYSVIAFPVGRTNEQIVLYKGPEGELPKPPKFLSGNAGILTYELPSGGTTNLTILRFATH